MVISLLIVALVVATIVITSGEDSPAALFESAAPGRWTPQSSGISADLFDVDFVNTSEGWAVGDGGVILHTSDAGQTWERQESVVTVALVSVDFVSASVGWAVGKVGVILHTSDGGESWEPQGAGETLGISMASVSFADESPVLSGDEGVGWAITEQGSLVLKTEDGGETWSRQRFPTNDARSDMLFLDAARGWATTSSGGVYRTEDGGESWNPQPRPDTDARLGTTGVFFLDENTGWVTGWRDKGQGLQFAQFLSDGAVLRTTDGGDTWALTELRTGKAAWDAAFVTPQEGWLVGSFGMIMYASDGGESWEPQPSGVEATLRAVAFADARNGWAVGEGGTILKYSR